MAVHKRDMVKTIAQQAGLSDYKTGQVVQLFLDQVIEVLVQHDRLELRDFGIFEVLPQKPRKLKHPVTGEPIYVPAQKVMGFKASKHLKKKLNKSYRSPLL